MFRLQEFEWFGFGGCEAAVALLQSTGFPDLSSSSATAIAAFAERRALVPSTKPISM